MNNPEEVGSKTPRQHVVALGVGVAAIVSLIVLAFLWPTVASEPRHVPIAIAGDTALAEQATTRLETQGAALFDLREVADRQEAVEAIETRDIYGAVVFSDGTGPEVLTTTAGSTAIAQSMTDLAKNVEQQLRTATEAQPSTTAAAPPGVTVTVTDVVPLAADDARGAGLAAALFPLVMGGLLSGVALSLVVNGTRRRFLGLVTASVASGLAITLILHTTFHILQGSFWENAAAVTLTISAMAATIVGAASLLGRAGMAVGPVLFMLFANPIASSASPVEFLPSPWGQIGQLFPPGAAARLLRDISYFPAADAVPQWAVLAAWTALGIALTLIAVARERRNKTRPADPAVAAQVSVDGVR